MLHIWHDMDNMIESLYICGSADYTNKQTILLNNTAEGYN